MPDGKRTKADIVDAVYVKTGFNRSHIKSVYEIIFSEIKSALVAGRSVELRGVGTFETRTRRGRKKARNPRTGEIVPVREHRAVVFRPGQELKVAVWNVPGAGDEPPANEQ
ncbi:MAG: integration host factor subunit beta [Spirochaetaceae bacterium]|jgi:integration host factor subunit beta|nr:integration host factor subunit beta [Spirochaetaceae bacterium]